MSQTRKLYDSCEYDSQIKQSTTPLAYNLYVGQVCNNNSCFNSDGPRNNRKNTTSSITSTPKIDLVDVDSTLSNRCKSDNSCNKYLKKCKKINKPKLPLDCSNTSSIDTRLEDDGSFRDLERNRWDWVPINPQCNIFWDQSINTRLAFKDNFEAINTKPIDQSGILPKEIKGKGKPICKLKCN